MPTVVPLVLRALALTAVGAVAGVAVNGLRADGIPLGPFAPPTACTAPSAAPTVEVLAPTEAVRVCGDPGVLVADTRSADRFAAGHVAGAIHLPCAASGSEADRALAVAAGKHTVVVYGDTTAEARPVAEDLRRRAKSSAKGGLRLVVVDGGFPAWDRAGLACSSGPCPDCAGKQGGGHR